MILILVRELVLLPVNLLLVLLGQHPLRVVHGKATFGLNSHDLGVFPDEVGYLEGLWLEREEEIEDCIKHQAS